MYANDDYILLLTKLFSGSITPEEAVLLDDWLTQSPDHGRLAAELRQVWEKTGGYNKTFNPDLDLAFGQVQTKLQQTHTAAPKMVPIGQRLMRIAAALVLLLSGIWAYREFSTPAPMKVLVAKEAKQLVNLSDGTRVWLRQHGTIEYPTRFTGAARRVNISGEAYFEVSHDPKHPFVVDMSNGDAVKVLGTEFGVRMSSGQSKTDVFVRSGKVFFSPETYPEGIVLTAHQKATYDHDMTQLSVDKSATLNELAWQTGGLEFVNTPMEEVIADLEAHYKVKISLKNASMRSCPHTALFTTQPIEKVLESLALTHQFRVSNPARDQFELTGGNCQ